MACHCNSTAHRRQRAGVRCGCGCRRLIAFALTLSFLVLPSTPALAAACSDASTCPLMALTAQNHSPCGSTGEVSGREMDCCTSRPSGEPLDPEVSVAPDAQVGVPAPIAMDLAAHMQSSFASLGLPDEPPDRGPPLFLLYAVFRL